MDEKGKEAEKSISQKGEKTLLEIETKQQSILQNIDEKGKYAEKNVSQEGEKHFKR
ncbi:hypothetical protein DPMN_038675 [Dreissena polymorpha]|uniref:Uncharacterized protein n=2 Tax=Dreissena polymorpha TaxID=45954 RepID=A0A9D4MFW0_DREPO|nr:hypothetical protein DPMN_038675 [Dreissena polymorpha]